MGRYRHVTSGALVSVRGGKVLGPEWEPVDAPSHGYTAMKVADLRAELGRRNEDREGDALLPTDGNKADLIATLEADDEA